MFEALRVAFSRAYRDHGRRDKLRGRLVSLFFVGVGVAVAIALAVLVLLAPIGLRLVEQLTEFRVPFGVGILRYSLGIIVFIGFLMALHRYLPGHALAVHMLWPGVLLSAIVWLVAAYGFSSYLNLTTTYVSTYGALAGVMITLIFFYISALVVIFGAEINAVLARDKEAWRG